MEPQRSGDLEVWKFCRYGGEVWRRGLEVWRACSMGSSGGGRRIWWMSKAVEAVQGCGDGKKLWKCWKRESV